MILMITVRIFLIVWLLSNVYVAYIMSASEMHNELVKEQCFVGRVFANIFYLPAWMLKLIKVLIK